MSRPTSQHLPTPIRHLLTALFLLPPFTFILFATSPWPDTPDGLFHLHRVRALATALRWGVLYPRWFPDFAFGYGYPVLNFYAPAFYYPPALLHLAGLDLITATRLTLAAFYTLSGWAAYLLLRRWTRPAPALLGALLYLTYPYHLYDLLVRGALPEFAAFLWPPLIAWATLQISQSAQPRSREAATRPFAIRHSHRHSPFPSPFVHSLLAIPRRLPANRYLLTAVFAWSALVLTHNLTALMTLLLALPLALLHLIRHALRITHHPSPLTPSQPPTADQRPAVEIRNPKSEIRNPKSPPRHSPFAIPRLLPANRYLLTALLTLALTSFYTLPVLLESRWVGIGTGPEARGYLNHFATLRDLVTWESPYPYPSAADPTVPLPTYAPIILLAAALLLTLRLALHALRVADRRPPTADRTPQSEIRILPTANRYLLTAIYYLLTAAVLTLWLTTDLSAPLWNALAPLLGKLQFPWRWQALFALALAVLLALLLELTMSESANQRISESQIPNSKSAIRNPQSEIRNPKSTIRHSPFANHRFHGFHRLGRSAAHPVDAIRDICVICGFAIRHSLTANRYLLTATLALYLLAYNLVGLRPIPAPYTAADLTPEQMWAFDAEHGQVGASWTGEFLPRWVTEQRWAIPRGAEVQGSKGTGEQGSPISNIQYLIPLKLGYLQEKYTYAAPKAATLTFHTFYYPAWRVEVDGRPVPTRPVTSLGLLAADLPAGEHTLTRRWAPTAAVWLGRVLTSLGWLGILALILLGKKSRRRWPIAAFWTLVGGVALTAALSPSLLAREVTPGIVEARYGPVTLQAAVVRPARPGETARVRLLWQILARPEPVTSFVHVLTPDGRVVAQHDGSLGGPYTPPSRWLPGYLLPDDHPIPIPPDLPPGAYTLKAGLYRPGQPQSPLLPAANPSDPRVPIGTLEVIP